MKARRWCLLSSVFVIGAFAASCAAEGDDAEPSGSRRGGLASKPKAPLLGVDAPEAIAGRYIVVFKPDAGEAAKGAAKARLSTRGRSHVSREYGVIPGFAAELDAADLDDLRDDPNVAFVEQDQIVHAVGTFPSPADGTDRVDQRQGRDGSYDDHDCTGQGVHAYIVDTGIRATHGEFTGRVGNGFDAVNDGQNGNDCNGHGSHVASTTAGTQFGMAKQATLHAVRVLNCSGSGSNAGVIAGIDFVRNDCTSTGRRCVANMSLGGGASSSLDNAVANAVNAGITFVVAAGNSNQNACNFSPARAPAAVTVGAVDDNDARASFSNFGTCVDLFAPGVSILGAAHTSNTATQSISGTSMASPHVAGAAAQFLGCNPDATPAQVLQGLLDNASRNCLTGLGTGSPNIMLYNDFEAGPFNCTGTPPPPPPSDNSCVDRCGEYDSIKACQCDWFCMWFGDCCPDEVQICG